MLDEGAHYPRAKWQASSHALRDPKLNADSCETEHDVCADVAQYGQKRPVSALQSVASRENCSTCRVAVVDWDRLLAMCRIPGIADLCLADGVDVGDVPHNQ